MKAFIAAILLKMSVAHGLSPIKIRPSEITPGLKTRIEIDGQTYSSDEHHIVLPNLPTSSEGTTKILTVFLPGTRTSPEEAIDFLKSVNDGPVIGLSYEYLNSPDAKRNQLCSKYTGHEYQKCLKNQHRDALWGGNSEPGLWQEITWPQSIEGRLTL